jgi:hypothetical protein
MGGNPKDESRSFDPKGKKAGSAAKNRGNNPKDSARAATKPTTTKTVRVTRGGNPFDGWRAAPASKPGTKKGKSAKKQPAYSSRSPKRATAKTKAKR